MIEVNWKPDQRTLRQFGVIAAVVLALFAACAWKGVLMFSGTVESTRIPIVAVLSGLGLLSALASLVAPRANLLLYRALTLVAYPIGIVVSYILLGVLFFLVITPIGLIRRAMGRDPLNRRLDPAVDSYWITITPGSKKNSYFRQF